MNDAQILSLFINRDEQAIRECMNCYGGYCRTVAASILQDPADVEEVLADTWMKAWETIPPNRPQYLRLYLGKVTRNLSLDMWRKRNAQCRGGGQVEVALEELGECIPTDESPEQWVDVCDLENAITAFLRTESATRRAVFLRRYFYMDEVSSISLRYGLKESNVRMMLARTRKRLGKYLKQEGYEL